MRQAIFCSALTMVVLFSVGCAKRSWEKSSATKSSAERSKSAGGVESVPVLDPVIDEGVTDYGTKWAVVIGIDDYSVSRNGRDALESAVRDAHDLGELLRVEFGYVTRNKRTSDVLHDNIIVLQNSDATVSNIWKLFDRILTGEEPIPEQMSLPVKTLEYPSLVPGYGISSFKKRLNNTEQVSTVRPSSQEDRYVHLAPGDSILVFFAGHGERIADDVSNEGYLLAYDSNVADLSRNAIRVSTLIDRIEGLPCRHAALFLDSCYSGAMFDDRPNPRNGNPRTVTLDAARGGGNGYYQEPVSRSFVTGQLSRRAFWGIAAALDTPAYEGGAARNSVFTSALLRSLKDRAGTTREDDLFTFQELALSIERDLENTTQSPGHGRIGKCEADFLFSPSLDRVTGREYQMRASQLRRYIDILSQSYIAYNDGRYARADDLLTMLEREEEHEDLRSFAYHHLYRRLHREAAMVKRGGLFAKTDRALFVSIERDSDWLPYRPPAHRLFQTVPLDDDTESEAWLLPFDEMYSDRPFYSQYRSYVTPSSGQVLIVVDDSVVLLCDLTEGVSPARLARYSHVFDVAFSPDSRFSAISTDQSVVYWDIVSRSMISEIKTEGPCGALAVSPDGKALAVAVAPAGHPTNWRVQAGAEKVLVVDPMEGTIRRELPSEKLRDVHVQDALEDSSKSIEFAFPGRLAFSCRDYAFGKKDRLAVMTTGGVFLSDLHEEFGFGPHSVVVGDHVCSIAFADDCTLAVGEVGGRIDIWDAVLEPRLIGSLPCPTGPYTMSFVFDSRILATAGGGYLRLDDLEATGAVIRLPFKYASRFSVAPNSNVIAVSAINDQPAGVHLWDISSDQAIRVLQDSLALGGPTGAVFSVDGRLIAAANKQGGVSIWDTLSGAKKLSVAGRSPVRFLPGTPLRLLVTDDYLRGKGNRIYNAHTGELLREKVENRWHQVSRNGQFSIQRKGNDYYFWDRGCVRVGLSALCSRYYVHRFSGDSRTLALAIPKEDSTLAQDLFLRESGLFDGEEVAHPSLLLIDTRTGRVLHAVELIEGGGSTYWMDEEVAFTTNLDTFVHVEERSSNVPSRVVVYDTLTGYERASLPLSGYESLSSPVFTSDGSRLILQAEADTIVLETQPPKNASFNMERIAENLSNPGDVRYLVGGAAAWKHKGDLAYWTILGSEVDPQSREEQPSARNEPLVSQAIDCYSEAVALRADYQSAYLRRARCWQMKGELLKGTIDSVSDDVRQCFTAAIEDYSKLIEMRRRQGNAVVPIAGGSYADLGYIHEVRAGLYLNLGEVEQFISDQTKAIELANQVDVAVGRLSHLAMCMHRLAAKHEHSGRYDDAVNDQRRAVNYLKEACRKQLKGMGAQPNVELLQESLAVYEETLAVYEMKITVGSSIESSELGNKAEH